jgi:hypothetical protein
MRVVRSPWSLGSLTLGVIEISRDGDESRSVAGSLTLGFIAISRDSDESRSLTLVVG